MKSPRTIKATDLRVEVEVEVERIRLRKYKKEIAPNRRAMRVDIMVDSEAYESSSGKRERERESNKNDEVDLFFILTFTLQHVSNLKLPASDWKLI